MCGGADQDSCGGFTLKENGGGDGVRWWCDVRDVTGATPDLNVTMCSASSSTTSCSYLPSCVEVCEQFDFVLGRNSL